MPQPLRSSLFRVNRAAMIPAALAGGSASAKCMAMADEAPSPALDRIERAIARIEAAAHMQRDENRTLAERHARLRARIGEAITSLDTLVAREREG